VGMCLELSGGFCGLGQAIMAEGKEHALAIGYTKMSARDMYGSLHRLMSGLAVDFLCGDLDRWLGWAAVVRW
jgi:hypothetical protein